MKHLVGSTMAALASVHVGGTKSWKSSSSATATVIDMRMTCEEFVRRLSGSRRRDNARQSITRFCKKDMLIHIYASIHISFSLTPMAHRSHRNDAATFQWWIEVLWMPAGDTQTTYFPSLVLWQFLPRFHHKCAIHLQILLNLLNFQL